MLKAGKKYLCRSGWVIGEMIALKLNGKNYLFAAGCTEPHKEDEYDEVIIKNKTNLNAILKANRRYL